MANSSYLIKSYLIFFQSIRNSSTIVIIMVFDKIKKKNTKQEIEILFWISKI